MKCKFKMFDTVSGVAGTFFEGLNGTVKDYKCVAVNGEVPGEEVVKYVYYIIITNHGSMCEQTVEMPEECLVLVDTPDTSVGMDIGTGSSNEK